MSLLRKINYIFSTKQKIQAVLLCIGLFIGALFELVGVSFIVQLVGIIEEPDTVHKSVWMQKLYDITNAGSDRQFFLYVVLLLIGIYLFKNVYLIVMNYVKYTFIYNNQLRLSGRLIDCYLRKPYTYHLDKNSAEMIRSIMLDSERFFQMLLTIFSIFSEIMVSALLCIYLLVVDWFITVSVVVILLVFSGLYLLIFHGRTKQNGKISQFNDGKMHQAINQALGAVKDIKILHREEYFVKAFTKRGEKKYTAVRNNEILGQIPAHLIETVCIGAILLVLVVKLYNGEDLNGMVSQLAAFAMAAFKLLPSVGKIDNYLNLIVFLKPSADLIYRDIKETEDMLSVTGKEADAGMEKADGITVQHVSYRYPNTTENVLTDVNFTIPDGTSVGLIGPSGAGKSTIADIILGILTPTEGKVMYGDMNVHEHPLKWSKKLAYIPQAIFLADETIRSNVAFGIDEDRIEEDKVWKALEEAQLDAFVRSLPEGLDTMVGERGVRLSGGQRQRIGIARALYGDPQILVLDEATSALDSETETAVMEAIDRLRGRKTLIIIAHRLSTIANCGIIFKVGDGQICDYTEEFRKENG
ncbi:MAG: ABC transporter ATP-binding protein [Lachnospiraceae bacterium]|nr:ABC transporter ATP-binding protein [Lachnospiraceae bacterium]MBO4903645.1 ABC transporter ATP-binding protein [Lachnospiraceae bacterium]